eukprot:CAMPEP_0172039420 /NCGR_PEP_ID=MMETSP1041-20130122/23895_1 /TAXON_ID=464988 /ORGANISM="Hemiselmis andersenii, Strain CCMP439" /LENGTH=89 /DNA_ID=CAMNT_0012697129 /DNA_START=174 /DNA_END=439 /DNA_ORIENTATION=-
MTSSSESLISTTPADSTATSVPVPIAMPRSAWESAGESLMPSPTIATVLPFACSDLMRVTLSPGRASAATLVMPTSEATLRATRVLSPV